MENSIEENIEELKRLLYRNELTQYGKRKLINYYEQQEKDYKKVLKEVKRYKNMYEAEKRIHIVRNEQLARKQQLVIKCNELENVNKELKEEIKSWKKYSDEQEENSIEKNNIICNLEFQIEKLQKENENFEKLNKDYSYSVDIVRENTRLRRQVFDLELENEKLKKTATNRSE